MTKDEYIEKLKSAKSIKELTDIRYESDDDPSLGYLDWHEVLRVYAERIKNSRIEVES